MKGEAPMPRAHGERRYGRPELWVLLAGDGKVDSETTEREGPAADHRRRRRDGGRDEER